MLKFKTGDTVKIIRGKDKGREGKIEKISPQDKTAIVPGLNIYKKHVKSRGEGVKSGIYDIPRPYDLSKIMLVCPSCRKPVRIGFKQVGNEKARYCKKCKKEIKQTVKK